MHPSRTYVLYNLLMGLANGAIIGAYTPFLIKVGLSLAEISLVNLVCLGASIVMEIPTGMLADGKSRRFSVSCGAAIFALGTALYALANGFWIALAAEFLAGIGAAFVSGALSAWLTDSLRHRGEGESLRRVLAGGAAASSAATLVGGFAIAYFLAPEYPRLCWLFSAAMVGLAFLVTRFAMDDSGEPLHRVSEFHAWRQSVSVLKKTTALKWVTAAAMCVGFVAPFNLYWTPLVSMASGPKAIAWAWIPIYGTVAAVSFAVRRRKTKFGNESGAISAALFFAGIGLVAFMAGDGLAFVVPAAVIHEIGRGMFVPLIETYTQTHVEEHYRATYGSLQSFLGKLGYVAVLLAVSLGAAGRGTKPTVIIGIVVVSGLGLVISSLVLWILRPAARTR